MKIKKISAIAVLAFSLLLCSCNKAPNNNPKNDDMEFLNTSWGMTPEEVKSALSLKDDDITDEEIGRMDAFIRMRDYNKKIFGYKPDDVILTFLDVGDGIKRLCDVDIKYSSDVDMQKVLNNMKNEFGNPISNIKEYQPFKTVITNKLRFISYDDSETLKLWGTSKIADVISEDKILEYQKVWGNYQSILNEDNWEDFSQNARLTTVIWSADVSVESAIYMNGYNGLIYDYINDNN